MTACLLAALAAAACGARPDAPADSRPNVILVTVESLRADHVGCYGYERATTPSLDALADEGTLYERAYAVTSWTLPSHASIFTGLYPAAHGVVAYDHRLDDSYTTLAEVLAGRGYQTAGFVSGPFLQKQYNLQQGFERYDDSTSNPEGNRAAHGDRTNPAMERLVTRFLEHERDGRPFFLFVYLWDPHYDYIPPPPYDKQFVPADAEPIDLRDYDVSEVVNPGITAGQLRYVVSQYDGEIACTDAVLGRLWAVLRDAGLWEGTEVIVTADHGEEFFEHGHKGHRNNLYEESVHVPLIVKPAGPASRARDDRPVSLIDLYPTILEAADVDDMPFHHGRSLSAPPDPSRAIFFELKSEWLALDPVSGKHGIVSDLWLAVRAGDAKLVLSRNDKRHEFYDLAADPGERHPLQGADARVAELDHRLDAYVEQMKRDAGRWERAAPIRLRPEQEERLRSLGYVGRQKP